MESLARTVIPADDRARVRALLIAARRTLSTAARERADRALRTQLDAMLTARLEPMAGCVLAAYWPLAGEPDLRTLFVQWSARGVVLALPVVVAGSAPLRFARYIPGAAMRAGAHGTVEPAARQWLDPDIVLAPCVGFSPAGWRLGYGGGYYDRTLAQSQALAIGIAYDEAQLEGLQPTAHDVPLSFVVTPRRLIDCAAVRRRKALPGD